MTKSLQGLIDVAVSWGQAWANDRWNAGPQFALALACNAHMNAMNVLALEACQREG